MSCNSTKYLQGDETLLRKNKITIKGGDAKKYRTELEYALENLLVQKPNKRVFGIPRSYFYFRNNAPEDTLWYNNFFRERLGEPPAIYDEKYTESSAERFKNYLANRKGFYDAQVTYEISQSDDYTEVEYIVNPAIRYKVNSVDFVGTDTATIEKLKIFNKESKVKKDVPIDEELFEAEKSRLVVSMQNQGYAGFAGNHINILGDSSHQEKTVDVFFEIKPPLPDSLHKVFKVGDIRVYTDYHRSQDTSSLYSKGYKGLEFYKQGKEYLVDPKVLEPMIYIKDKDVFSRSLRDRTFRKLSRLGSYRFVTIDPVLRLGSEDTLDYNIFLTPFDKRWVADYGMDAFYATLNQSKNSKNRLLGFSLNSLFKNRNLLGGDEQFSIGAETGVELEIRSPLLVRTFTFSIDNALRFPRQVDLLGFSRLVKLFDFRGGENYQLFKEETETTVGLGFSHIDIRNFYAISTLRSNYTYTYQPRNNTKFIIRQVGLDLNIYDIKREFRDELENNPLLAKSFQNTLLTGYLFRDISYIHSNARSSKGNSQAYIINFEASGWETYLVNKVYNAIKNENVQWKFTDNVDFAKYFRMDADIRLYKHFKNENSFVTRFYLGGIIPFGKIKRSPYIRQFSVGGPNSMRAWDQRELGPGSFDSREINELNPNIPFYQQGDLRLELNLEYRFKLFWLVEGALFTDAGNVWNIREDAKRPGAKITKDFYDQIAIGAGYGIRFDFDYFNIRFDFGYKVKYPYDIGDGSKFSSWDGIRRQGLGNFQVAVNYPF